jgi:hypothetical protein
VRRTFAFDDTDVAVSDPTVSIDLGDELPAGAFVLAVLADITQDFTDGATGVFGADVGVSGGDSDKYTPTELNIDGGAAVQTQCVFLDASETQLAVTFTSDVDLDTLTGGSVTITVLYVVPTIIDVEAP